MANSNINVVALKKRNINVTVNSSASIFTSQTPIQLKNAPYVIGNPLNIHSNTSGYVEYDANTGGIIIDPTGTTGSTDGGTF